MIRLVFILLIATAAPITASADDLPLKDGRYPGEVIIFQLTNAQRGVADKFWNCHMRHSDKMNVYTPYIFTLTQTQADEVRRRVGYAPKYFEVYETRKGFNDAGPHWNLALRFTESEIEIPVPLLVPDSEAIEAHEVQGWERRNPCFKEVNVR